MLKWIKRPIAIIPTAPSILRKKWLFIQPVTVNENNKLKFYPENYRPISFINNFAKIFEKCLKDRLIVSLQENKRLSKNQYSFLEGLGTVNATYTLTSDIMNIHIWTTIKKNWLFYGPNYGLRHCASQQPAWALSYGIRRAVLELFKIYLSNRDNTWKSLKFLAHHKKYE